MVQKRHPQVAGILVQGLNGGGEMVSLKVVRECATSLTDAGCVLPCWLGPPIPEDTGDPFQPRQGWQHFASNTVEELHLREALPALPPPRRALVRSQGGPISSRPLGRRGFAVESAIARICREGGARVSTNVFVRDLDLRRKERTYHELVGEGGRARLVILAGEVGGRWSLETANFLRALAVAKACDVPYVLQASVEVALFRRWSNILSFAAARAFAAALLEWRGPGGAGADAPSSHDVNRF